MIAPLVVPIDRHDQSQPRIGVGDFVVVTLGRPTVCVVEMVGENGLIRVKKMGWPQVCTAVVNVRDVRHLGWLLNNEPWDDR